MKSSKIFILLAFCALTLPSADVFAADIEDTIVVSAPVTSEIYQVHPVRFEIPWFVLEKATEANAKILTNSKLYFEVVKGGKVIWRSKWVDINKGNNTFSSWGDDSDFTLIAKEGDEIDVKVFVVDNETALRLERASVGAGGGAALGAGIGAAITGFMTGGMGAPMGAFIGGAIGAVCGGGTSQVVPVDGAIEVANFRCSSPIDLFKSKKEETRERGIPGIKESVCSAEFRGYRVSDFKKKLGELEQQENYIVRFKKIYLSLADEGVQSGRYYLKVKSHDFEQKINLGEIPQGVEYPIAIEDDKLLVLKNRLGETRLEIYRERPWWPDKCVFSASQGASDGSTWLFMGRLSEGGKKSWVEVETLGKNKK